MHPYLWLNLHSTRRSRDELYDSMSEFRRSIQAPLLGTPRVFEDFIGPLTED